MAWTPPKQKAFEPGEIPGKKEISDEERANLEEHRPNKDVEAMFGGDSKRIMQQIETLPAVQQEQLDPLLSVGNGQAISDWLQTLQDSKDFGLGIAVLENNFESEMMVEIGSSGHSFLTSEVLKIVYLKELRPIMFYFGIGIVNDNLRVAVTPIPDWEKIGLWDASTISDNVVPEFLVNVQASVYDFDKTMTASQVRKDMVHLGFVEKHEIIS